MDRRLPQLESLRVFEVSARHANFSRAADELGVTPAAVSLRVRELESDLGQRLFLRNGPRISLTPAGMELAARLAEIMVLARAAVAACRSDDSPLRLTVNPTFARWFAPRLPRYRAVAGAARIRLDVSTELRSPDQFDIAIRSGNGNWPGMIAKPLLSVELTPMLSPALAAKFPIRTPADLQALPLFRDVDWLLWFQQAGVPEPRLSFAPVEYETQDMEAWAAAEGAGVGLFSPVLFADLLAEGKLVRPLANVLHWRKAHFTARHRHDHRLSVDHFIAWLGDEVKAASRI